MRYFQTEYYDLFEHLYKHYGTYLNLKTFDGLQVTQEIEAIIRDSLKEQL